MQCVMGYLVFLLSIISCTVNGELDQMSTINQPYIVTALILRFNRIGDHYTISSTDIITSRGTTTPREVGIYAVKGNQISAVRVTAP